MTHAAERMLALVRAAVFGSVEACADARTELDAAEEKRILTLARQHDLRHLLSIGAERCGVKLSDETRAAADSERMTAVYRYVGIRGELAAILDTLEEGGIDHLPMKGSVIRAMYPEAWMRTSCDVDILVKEGELAHARELLEAELEYKYIGMGNHDISFESPGGVHLELHYKPLNDYVLSDYEKPLGNVFDKLVIEEGFKHRYRMPDEYFYYYHVAHMAKHYVNGGSGVRSLVDLRLLLLNDPDLPKKAANLLSEGSLVAFDEAARHLADVWFGDGEHTDLTRTMEEYIVFSGVYGDMENMIASSRGEGGKLGYLFARAFPKYEIMCDVYPSLVGKRWLMPLYWLRRLCRIIFTPRLLRRSFTEIRANNGMSEEKISKVTSSMRQLGLRSGNVQD
jgi:hypothetical protein